MSRVCLYGLSIFLLFGFVCYDFRFFLGLFVTNVIILRDIQFICTYGTLCYTYRRIYVYILLMLFGSRRCSSSLRFFLFSLFHFSFFLSFFLFVDMFSFVLFHFLRFSFGRTCKHIEDLELKHFDCYDYTNYVCLL